MVVAFVTAVMPVLDHNLKLRHRLETERARLDFQTRRQTRLAADAKAAEDDPFFVEVMARRELKQSRPGEQIRTVPVAPEHPATVPPPAIARHPGYRRVLAVTTDPTNRSVLYTCSFSLILVSIFLAVRSRPRKRTPHTVAVEPAHTFDETDAD